MVTPMVALVGRPNVGKSTLFNRIVGERVAIIEDVAGTTRDRLYYDADWAGREFTIVDTGGFEIDPGSDLINRVRQQAEVAIREADVVVFVVDARQGVTPGDLDVAKVLRGSEKPVIVAVNKADSLSQQLAAAEFFSLGLPALFSLSALHGTGTGDLLDAVVDKLPPPEEVAPEEGGGVRVALVGRPNVGKSSLFNAIVGQERAVVTEIPGTTRDVVDARLEFDSKELTLLDTAGMRRRGRVEAGIEYFSVLRTARAIERADVVVVVMDASEGVTAQDTHLAGFARDQAKGIVLVVNKWDVMMSWSNQIRQEWTLRVREDMKFIPYAPLFFVSAKERRNVGDVVSEVFKISEQRHKRVSTPTLNDLLQAAIHAHSPGAMRGRQFKIYYATQATVNPPTFVFFVNDASLIRFSYQRYLENRLREAFGFEGTAIRLIFRTRVERGAAQRA
ncbi:MAG: ribosome biogenesis GTPase Der [Chloroflexota bacterium]